MDKITKEQLEQMIKDGGDVELLPSSLESAISGLREDMKAEAAARRQDAQELKQALLSAVKAMQDSKQSPVDIEKIMTRVAAIVNGKPEKPSYLFEVTRDTSGFISGIVATPKTDAHRGVIQ